MFWQELPQFRWTGDSGQDLIRRRDHRALLYLAGFHSDAQCAESGPAGREHPRNRLFPSWKTRDLAWNVGQVCVQDSFLFFPRQSLGRSWAGSGLGSGEENLTFVECLWPVRYQRWNMNAFTLIFMSLANLGFLLSPSQVLRDHPLAKESGRTGRISSYIVWLHYTRYRRKVGWGSPCWILFSPQGQAELRALWLLSVSLQSQATLSSVLSSASPFSLFTNQAPSSQSEVKTMMAAGHGIPHLTSQPWDSRETWAT